MKYNKKYSETFYRYLYELGVFAQLDGTFAVAERLPRRTENVYIEKFDSLLECTKHIKTCIEELKENFVSIWKNLEEDIKTYNKKEELPKIVVVKNEMFMSTLDVLFYICSQYKFLDSYNNLLKEIKEKADQIGDDIRQRLTYYSTILNQLDVELITECERLHYINIFIEKNTESKIQSMLKIAGVWGEEEGIGPRGRNNPLTPFSRFDSFYDRVMDGTQINDHSGGHATEKFLGIKGYNKFKRHPELLLLTRDIFRRVPSRFLKRKLNRRLRKLLGNIPETEALDVMRDPTYYSWWEHQRQPYLFDERAEEGTYPSWAGYKKRL